MELSRRAYAKHRGVDEASVRRALKRGWITINSNGKIEVEIADQQWEQQACSNDARSMNQAYQRSRALREAYCARMAKLEYEKASGKWISVEKVSRESFSAGRELRDRLLALPDRIGPQLVGKTDAGEVRAILEEAFLEALSVLPTSDDIDTWSSLPLQR